MYSFGELQVRSIGTIRCGCRAAPNPAATLSARSSGYGRLQIAPWTRVEVTAFALYGWLSPSLLDLGVSQSRIARSPLRSAVASATHNAFGHGVTQLPPWSYSAPAHRAMGPTWNTCLALQR